MRATPYQSSKSATTDTTPASSSSTSSPTSSHALTRYVPSFTCLYPACSMFLFPQLSSSPLHFHLFVHSLVHVGVGAERSSCHVSITQTVVNSTANMPAIVSRQSISTKAKACKNAQKPQLKSRRRKTMFCTIATTPRFVSPSNSTILFHTSGLSQSFFTPYTTEVGLHSQELLPKTCA